MNKVVYIVQQQEGRFGWLDITECCTASLARKYCVILRDKYPQNFYRIVRWSYNV